LPFNQFSCESGLFAPPLFSRVNLTVQLIFVDSCPADGEP
jgi:hypothetical protein